MLKAYETDSGRGIYWQVFEWKGGDTSHVSDMETLDEVMKLAREKQAPLTIYTQEWAENFEKEGE
jgi:hypothetical protein